MDRARLTWLVSLALAMPGALMIADLAQGTTWAMDLLHPSGEMAVRLVILAMLAGPVTEIFGANRVTRAWLSIRRQLGLAAFGYALLHLAFYALDMTPAGMLGELSLPGIWTGWLALALLAPPGAVSFDRAVRRLGRRWRTIQRLVYGALALAMVHWLLLAWSPVSALVHIAPLILAWSARAWRRHQIKALRRKPSTTRTAP